MSNPAQRLADIFDAFTVPVGVYPENARARALGLHELGDTPEDSAAFWRAQADVVSLVRETERLIEAIAADGVPVEHFRSKLPLWYQAAFAFSTPWATKPPQGGKRAVSTDDLLFLRSLGTTFTFAKAAVDASLESSEKLSTSFQQCKDLLAEADFLPQAMRQYLYQLVAEGLEALSQYKTFGATPARHVAFSLAGGLQAVVETGAVPEADEGKWRSVVRDVLTNWVSAGGIAIGGLGWAAATRVLPGA